MKFAAAAIAMTMILAPAVGHAAPEKPKPCAPEGRFATPPTPEQIAWDQSRRKNLERLIRQDDADSMVDMARLLEQGSDSAPPDRVAAFDLYEKAANKRQTLARRKMCVAYLLGEGRPRDIVKGMRYCNALGVKDPIGLFAAGYDYEMGLSGPKDEQSALLLYSDAVKLGSGEAADALGRKTFDIKRPDLARKWFRRGSYLGSPDAMAHLAAMTEAGEGGPADPDEARWLYGLAARFGNIEAATHSAGAQLPQVCMFEDGKPPMSVMRSYTDKAGVVKQESIGFPRLSKLLTDSFPRAAIDTMTEGRATIECYVAGDHTLDVCVLKEEYPVGLGFGPILEAIFNGHIVVGENDAGGFPTAHRLIGLRVNWQINR